jgi:hypothetical protein
MQALAVDVLQYDECNTSCPLKNQRKRDGKGGSVAPFFYGLPRSAWINDLQEGKAEEWRLYWLSEHSPS